MIDQKVKRPSWAATGATAKLLVDHNRIRLDAYDRRAAVRASEISVYWSFCDRCAQ